MQGIISISQVTPSRLYTLNLIFTQVSEHTLDYIHVINKAGLNDLVEQMH